MKNTAELKFHLDKSRSFFFCFHSFSLGWIHTKCYQKPYALPMVTESNSPLKSCSNPLFDPLKRIQNTDMIQTSIETSVKTVKSFTTEVNINLLYVSVAMVPVNV